MITQDTLKQLNSVQSEIDKANGKLRDIDTLIKSGEFTCTVSKNFESKYRRSYIKYYIQNNEKIVELLNEDKITLQEELQELNIKFHRIASEK